MIRVLILPLLIIRWNRQCSSANIGQVWYGIRWLEYLVVFREEGRGRNSTNIIMSMVCLGVFDLGHGVCHRCLMKFGVKLCRGVRLGVVEVFGF